MKINKKHYTSNINRYFSYRISGLLLLIFVFVSSVFPSFPVKAASLTEKRTIRVAYPIQKGLTDIDENGDFCGYTYDYLMEISRYTNWNYEFVMTDSDTDKDILSLMSQVETGEIDLLTGTLYMDQLSDIYTYCNQSYGLVETTLQTTYENFGNVVINSQVSQSMRIAVLNLTGRTIEEATDYCKMNLIEPIYIECANEAEQIELIKAGQADALLNTSLNKLDGVITVAKFSPKPFYFVTAKNKDDEMMLELGKAIYNIEQANPYFSQELFEKYFGSTNTAFSFTEEEETFINETTKHPLRIGVIENNPPFYYQDSNLEKGILVDYLDLIAKKSGLTFDFVSFSTIDDLIQFIDNGELDLIIGLTDEQNFLQDRTFILSQTFLSTQYMLINNQPNVFSENENPVQATAVLSPYVSEAAAKYQTQPDCIRAVYNGEADFTYVDSCTAQYFINQPEYSSLFLSPVTTMDSMDLHFGIVDSSKHKLAILLNKCIRSISEDELQPLISLNTIPNVEVSLKAMIHAHPFAFALLIILILSIIFSLVLLLYIQRNKNNKIASLELKKRLHIYSLADDYFFEYDYKKQLISISIPDPKKPNGIQLVNISRNQLLERYGDTEKGNNFLKLLDSHNIGIHELYSQFMDLNFHWYRVFLDIIYSEENIPAYAVGKINMIDKEHKEKEQLQLLAQKDSLTGLYNAKTFQDLIIPQIEMLSENEFGALLLIDIDFFKNINDTFGHKQGDVSLCQIASLLQSSVRSEDYIGRFGGDEFVIYINNIDGIASLEKRCHRVCQLIRFETAKSGCPITISVGAVLVKAGKKYDSIFNAADSALYKTKQKGRNGYTILDQNGQLATLSAKGVVYDDEDQGLMSALWIQDKKLESVLRSLRAIVFEFHAKTGKQFASSFISDYLKGNYDGRPLSVVMLEDNVIHPDDINLSLEFRECCRRGETGDMILRLLTIEDEYHWHKMIMTYCPLFGEDVYVGFIMDIHKDVTENWQRL